MDLSNTQCQENGQVKPVRLITRAQEVLGCNRASIRTKAYGAGWGKSFLESAEMRSKKYKYLQEQSQLFSSSSSTTTKEPIQPLSFQFHYCPYCTRNVDDGPNLGWRKHHYSDKHGWFVQTYLQHYYETLKLILSWRIPRGLLQLVQSRPMERLSLNRKEPSSIPQLQQPWLKSDDELLSSISTNEPRPELEDQDEQHFKFFLSLQPVQAMQVNPGERASFLDLLPIPTAPCSLCMIQVDQNDTRQIINEPAASSQQKWDESILFELWKHLSSTEHRKVTLNFWNQHHLVHHTQRQQRWSQKRMAKGSIQLSQEETTEWANSSRYLLSPMEHETKLLEWETLKKWIQSYGQHDGRPMDMFNFLHGIKQTKEKEHYQPLGLYDLNTPKGDWRGGDLIDEEPAFEADSPSLLRHRSISIEEGLPKGRLGAKWSDSVRDMLRRNPSWTMAELIDDVKKERQLNHCEKNPTIVTSNKWLPKFGAVWMARTRKDYLKEFKSHKDYGGTRRVRSSKKD